MFEALKNLLFSQRRTHGPRTPAPLSARGERSEDQLENEVLRLRSSALDALNAGRYEFAAAELTRVIDLKHDSAEAHFLLGVLYRKQGRVEDATDSFVLATCFDPRCAKAHFYLGLLAQQKGENDQALRHFEKALACKPDYADARVNLGKLLLDRGDYAAACEHFSNAIASDPGNALAHSNLGYALLKGFSRAEEALHGLDAALRLEPELAVAHCNRGMVLQYLGRCEEAIAACDRALALSPGSDQARLNRSLALLMMGDYANGWREYEIRKKFHKAFRLRALPYPEWNGDPLSKKTILVQAEQGLGDQIMFASCMPDLLQHAGHCVIECHSKLEKLFARSFPAATVIGCAVTDKSCLGQAPPVDCRIFIGSLPLHFRKTPGNFPRHTGYLNADAARVSYWRERLDTLGPGPKIGISWRGGTLRSNQRARSLSPEELLPVLRVPGAHFISLQYADYEADIAALRERYGVRVECWHEAIDDFDETAALIAAVDHVISVDTTVVHLSGALGRPAWVMVPASAEWRYQRSSETLPWYPSLRMFRQVRLGEWQVVIAHVANELRRLVAAPHCVK